VKEVHVTEPTRQRSRRRRAAGTEEASTETPEPAGAFGVNVERASDAEVVAALLDPDAPTRAMGVAEALVATGLRRMRGQRFPDRLRGAKVRPEQADRLLAAIELGRRVFDQAEPTFDSPEIVYCHSRDLATEHREHFAVILLNARYRYIRRELVSIGSLNASIVHPREVFRPAIRAAAAAVVLVHNHPSGDPAPSRDDIEITRRLVRAGELVGIDVLDHVIVTTNGYCSLRRERLL
jgi:DNA repair protein RadC